MADEEKPSGPLEDRLSHKNWKWRVNGYEELTSKFKLSEDGTGPLFNEYGPKFKVFLADANPMSQEKVLDTLGAFIERCDVVNKFAGTFVPVLVEKCFPSTRPKVKDKTIELLNATIEADSAEPVIESLIKGTSSTSPKIFLYSLIGIRECLKTFGPKVFTIKPIFQKFTPWFENRDKNVREEASNILIEIYRWIGKPILPLIQEGLTPIQLKALIEAFDKLPSEPAIPLKMTRSEAAKQLTAAAKGASGGGASAKKEEVEEFDPFAMMPAVNVLSKIGEEFFVGCKAAKWQERQEQIDRFTQILQSSPKIENGDFGPVCTVLKKLMADNNVIIMTKAVIVIGLLAEGLRNQFASNSKQFVLPIIERFKEKKSNIINALHATLDTLVTKCFGLNDIFEDVVSGIANAKVAWIKEQVFIFIARTITNTKKPQDILKLAKPLAKIFMDNIVDQNEIVRESSAKAFGALGGIIGERGMNPYLGQMDPMKAKKVKDAMPAVQASVAATPAVTMQAVDVSELDLGGGAKSAKPAATSSKKPAAGKSTTTTTTTTTSSGKTTGKSKDDDSKSSNNISADEIQEKVKSIISEDQLNGLSNSNWKDRLQSIEDIQETIKGLTGDTLNSMSEFIILYLQDKPGWKENNFQVFSGMLQIISYLAKNDSSFNKNTANHFLSTVIEKISDVKLKDLSVECLFTVSEVISPQAVFSVLYPFAQSHKNPKVTADSVMWISQALEEFGVSCATNMKMLIDFCKSCLESTQPTVKQATIKLLCTIRISVGSGISDFLSDIKKPLLDSIDKEFVKVRDQRPSAPSRTWKGAPPPGSGSKGGELPKTDISGKISSSCIDNMSDNNWKTRSDALDEVERIIYDANKRLQPKLGSLVPALKNRLTDSNQKVLTTTLNIITLLSLSIGSPFDKNAKVLLPGVLALLSDSKKPVRDAAIATINQLLQDLGFDVFIGCLAAPMIVESATSKKEALTFATTNWQIKAPVVMAEMTTLCKAICLCLSDKNADIRSLSEQLLGLVSQYTSLNDFKKEFREVKQANLANVTAIIEKHYKAKAAGGVTAPTSTSAKNKPGTVSPTNAGSPIRATPNTTTTTTTKQTKSQPQASNDSFIISDHNAKVARQKDYSGKSWIFDEPTEEVLEVLQNLVSAGFSEEFGNLMFSANPTQAQQMSDSLLSAIESDPDIVVNVLDILFRWVTFKLFDMGLASQKRILKILDAILAKLVSLEYTLSDYEASCLVPLLTERMSTSNESIKVLIKNAVKLLEELCPPNFMFKYIMENCKSNNWRTRLECINEIATLVDKSGLSLFSNNSSNLKTACSIISQNLNEPNIKPTCILYYQKLYLHIRDEIWKFLPQNLSNSDKTLISGSSNTTNNNNNSSNKPNSTSKPSPAPNSDDVSNQFKGYLDILHNYQVGKDVEYTVESLKQFSTYLTANGSQTSVSDKFIPYLENYLIIITKLLDEIFPNVFKDQSLFRLCKYLIHSIITIYSNDAIAKQSTTKILQIVLTESIKLLVSPPSESNTQNTDSDWITKAFNQVLLRILQNSNATILFSTLLLMITAAKNNKSPDKYNDLLLRCLLRATKLLKPVPGQLSISQDDLNVTTLMNEINKFLSSTNLDDTTKRATKTLTTELINVKGQDIFKFFRELISTHKHTNYTPLLNLLQELLGKSQFEENIGAIPPPIDIKLDSKLDNVVGSLTLGSGNGSSGSGSNLSLNRTSSGSNVSLGSGSGATGTGSAVSKFSTLKVDTAPRNYKSLKTEEERESTLKIIFKKIGDTQMTMDGIYDLYYFLQVFPNEDLSPFLSLTTTSFQQYINRNLEKIKQSIENPPKDKSDDEFKKYSENLTKLQNTFHQQSSPQHSQHQNNHQQSPTQQNIQSSTSNTLQRMRENINISNPNLQSLQNTNTINNNNSNPDLQSTVASLRQRLAQIKETSKSNE